MMRKTLSLIFFCCIVAGCGSNENPSIQFKLDMDQYRPWFDNPPVTLISDPNAYSGRYVCRLDSLNIYSPTFHSRLSAVSKNRVKTLKLCGWFKLKDNSAKPSLVIEIKDGYGKSLEILRQNFNDPLSEPMRWTRLELEADLTINNRNNPDNFLRIYAMNDSGSFILLDDLQINLY